ncbi:MAG: translation initiation factor IF-2 [Desulfurivibrio sp.]|nr:translation initiation factor IF-2 [Desulfurivibrio sp.]
MKKIRVYELAKEAGMENKALVAQLQDEGYAVKSHSSTLDEREARAIRVKLGLAAAAAQEQPAREEGRKTTILRRRKPAAAEESPPAATADAEATAKEATASSRPAADEGSDAVAAAGQAAATEVGAAASATEEAPAPTEVAGSEEEAAPPAADNEEVAAAGAEAGTAEQPSDSEPAETSAAPESPAAEAESAPPAARKGLARVIKKAAITITPEADSRPTTSRPRRPEKTQKPGTTAPAPAGEAAGAKKKGKRFVKFQPEPEREPVKKGAGGKRKRQAEVVADDFDEVGLVPAGVRLGRGGRSGGRRGKQQVIKPQHAAETKAIKKRITVHETITVGDLAHRMGAKANEVIAKLMGLGVMATVNQAMDIDTASLVAAEFGYEVEQGKTEEQGIMSLEEQEAGGEARPRPPVVTVMGHVDHGKTSILDAIRTTDVAEGEAGGITQHIGAHYVRAPQGEVVFLDTPGHEAFTEMRSRGAQVTDIVVLVVAADDGVMGQTREAINHARAAEVPIIVCVNKIDKNNADSMRVKRELSDLGLMPEDWGGEAIYCETSAKQGTGISELLDNILLQAEILELRADPQRRGKGHVVEAQLHKGRGPVATVLVQEGTLRLGDALVAGQYSGKVRSLINDKGEQVKEAGPSIPVEIQGLSGVPQAGDEFVVVRDDKMAKSVSAERQLKVREQELAADSKISLDNLFDRLQEGEVKELMVVLRADVQGTLGAFASSLEQLSTDAVKVRVLNSGTGTVTESDVLLAAASDALIIGFNVRPTARIQELAKRERVDMRFYDVIYHALEDIKKAMEGMLEPEFVEQVIGSAEVRQTFHVSKVGTIAGCYITSGKAERNAKVRLLREGVVVFTGQLSSLKRFKDDAKEVATGYECGMSLRNYNDIKEGDILEFFVLKEVKPEL